MVVDAIVVGLGAHGAATLYQLARRGVRALGVDRWSPPHAMGSSHGETRATRQGVGEGEAYAPLVLRSHEIWRELEAVSGETLLVSCGMLFISSTEGGQIHGAADFIGRSAAVARRFAIAHELLDSGEVAHRFPQFLLQGGERAYYEPGGGFVYPERCIAVQLREAERLGARILRDAAVEAVGDDGDAAWIRVAGDVHRASTVVVTAGAWTPSLVREGFAGLKLQPQVLHWFSCDNPRLYAADRTPVFAWMHGDGAEDSFYGFPIAPDSPAPLVKVAMEQIAEIAAVDDLDRTPPEGSANRMFAQHLSGRLAHISPSAARSEVCLYSMAPDAAFRLPRSGAGGRIIGVSACSGHGFKHSAALGELLSTRVIDGLDVRL